MQKKGICSFIGISAFLLASCGEENPAVFPIETSSNDISLSSSFSTQYSSSINDIESSSSIVVSSSVESSSSSWEPYSYGELTDERDGQTYKTIKIGEQTWMAENLNYAYLQPTSTKDSSSECYNNSPDSCAKYGRLYLWSAAMDSAAIFSKDGKDCGIENLCSEQPYKGVRGICPDNWHIPNEPDMNNVVNYANESIGNQNWLKHYWFLASNENDAYKVQMLSRYSSFWTSAEVDYRIFRNYNTAYGLSINSKDYTINKLYHSKESLIPIRCVKDDKTIQVEHGEMTDERDGQIYKTVKIGTQTWMAENLNYAYPKQDSTSDSVSWCSDNVPENCTKYGRLYTWNAAMDSASIVNRQKGAIPEDYYDYTLPGACPKNWHIPSVNEWNTLLGLVNNFATDLKSASDWVDDGNGTDILGFNVLPAGIGRKSTCFWTPVQITYSLDEYSVISDYEKAFCYCFSSNDRGVSFIDNVKEEAYSVRCVKDAETSE